MTIDDIDLRILDMLQRNGKLSQAKIAGAVGLTTPSVNERIKKMERHGMIKGFVALLDHEKMGFPLTAYVDVALEHPRFEKGFVDDLEKLLDVQECHYLAGEYAYRLKVKAADPATLADFLQRRLLAIKGVVARAHRDLPVVRRRNRRSCPCPSAKKKTKKRKIGSRGLTLDGPQRWIAMPAAATSRWLRLRQDAVEGQADDQRHRLRDPKVPIDADVETEGESLQNPFGPAGSGTADACRRART